MLAAIVRETGADPVVEEFADPSPSQDVAQVVAAALNPVDIAVVNGQIPFRRIAPPFVAGVEGVARRDDGSHRYFFAPEAPYGSFAEAVPLANAEMTAAVPAELDPVTAAALGVSGLAAHLSLTRTGSLAGGEDVLVLGADGQVGRMAVQLARSLGAGRVIGVVRGEEARQAPLGLGADAAVSSADVEGLGQRLREAAPDGVDLILDLVWGPVIGPALEAARQGARVVQIGNAGGPTATLSAPAFRNKAVRFLPHSNFLFSAVDRAAAFEELAARAVRGEVEVDVERVPLTEATAAYRRLATGAADRKLVLTSATGGA
jgi:NADPH:quinone reductase